MIVRHLLANVVNGVTGGADVEHAAVDVGKGPVVSRRAKHLIRHSVVKHRSVSPGRPQEVIAVGSRAQFMTAAAKVVDARVNEVPLEEVVSAWAPPLSPYRRQ